MDMTDEQRRWWFASHPEFSSSRKTALANERLRRENFIQKMMDAGWSRAKAEEKWQLAESVAGPARGLAWAFEQISQFGRAGRGLPKTVSSFAARGSRRPPRLPPVGTSERAKIEAVRKRGERAKMREELRDIENDGAGSGLWTKKELEEIRKTKKFPPDTTWHHEPSVANRPELAHKPQAVRPIRGGRKGHLRDGHGGNWQEPYDPGGKAPWE
jgi:hypothetical protein